MRNFSDEIDATQNYVCSITPIEFELFCMEILKNYAAEEGLNDFKIEHDAKIKADDGIFQIDIFASFTALRVEFKILCECKQFSTPVKRES